MRIRSEWLRGSIYWVLPLWGRVAVTKPLSQIHRSTLLPLQDTDPTPSFGGFGLSHMICGTVNSIPHRISVQSFTQKGKIARRRPDEPSVHAGRVLTHDQLLQWVWGPEKTGQPWLVREVV